MNDELAALVAKESLFDEASSRLHDPAGFAGISAHDADHLLAILVTGQGWGRLDSAHRGEGLALACSLVARVPPPLRLLYCERLALLFKTWLTTLREVEPWVMENFDNLSNAWYAAAGEITDAHHIAAYLVRPYMQFVRGADRGLTPAAQGRRRRHRVCLLSQHPSHHSNSLIGRTTARLARGMAEHLAQSEIHVYAVGRCPDELSHSLEASGCCLASSDATQTIARQLEAIESWLAENEIGILVADACTALSIRLFERRVAPVQVYHDPLRPFWSSTELDRVFTHVENEHWLGYRPDQAEILPPFFLHPQAEDAPVDARAIAALRSRLPAGAFLFAAFARHVEIGREYLQTLEEIVARNSNAFICLFGHGDTDFVAGHLARRKLTSRIWLADGTMDLDSRCRAVDACLDTFPCVGGSALQKASLCGLPVVTMANDLYRSYFGYTRDPRLLAQDRDGYAALACRLAAEPDFLSECQGAAKAIGLRQLAIGTVTAQMDQAFSCLWPERLAAWERRCGAASGV
jgi:hypothetical protein